MGGRRTDCFRCGMARVPQRLEPNTYSAMAWRLGGWMKLGYMLALTVLAPPVALPVQAQLHQATALTRDEQLGIMADYYLPPALADIGREICHAGYRSQLVRDPAMVEPEKAMPGLIDRMVTTASAQCDRELPLMLDRHREAVKAYWTTAVGPQQLARLAAALAPSARAVRDVNIESHPGETFEELGRRLHAVVAEKRRQAMQSTPPAAVARGDEAIAALARKYGETSQKDLESDPHGMNAILDDAMRASIHAANSYAHEKGFADLFPEPPGSR